jgi:hypothetical protein
MNRPSFFPTQNKLTSTIYHLNTRDINYTNTTKPLNGWPAFEDILSDEVANIVGIFDFNVPSWVPAFGGHYGIDKSSSNGTKQLSFTTRDGIILLIFRLEVLR